MYERKTTKEIKAALVKKFKHKFSVRKDRGTASHWVSISWTDGPTEKAVRAFTATFNDTARDDIMTDLWCGSQYTSETRHLTYDASIKAVEKVCKKWGVDMADIELEKRRSWDDKYDYLVVKNHSYRVENAGEYFDQLVWREAYKMDFREGANHG